MANTPEYGTIIQCFPKLTSAAQHDLSALSGELLAAGLITENNHSAIKNKYVPEHDRASDLIEFVRNKVKLDPKNYDMFIEVLKQREAEHESILKILEKKYKKLSTEHPPLHTTQSVPANMDEDEPDHVDRPPARSMSTPDFDGNTCIQWFKQKGMNLPKDLHILKDHGVSPLCLSELREEHIAIICDGMSIGGQATFKKLCAGACNQLPRIKETPHNEDRMSTSSGVAQSCCQPITDQALGVGNGPASRIEHQPDQLPRTKASPHNETRVSTNSERTHSDCQPIARRRTDSELDKRLEMPQHYMVCEYLRELPDDIIRMLGGALGLSYIKLQKMKSLPEDMVAAWIRREDDVIKNGDPTLRNLAEALKQPGITQTGVVNQILGL